MRLTQAFLQLPLHFDSAALRAELSRIPEESWQPHPQGHPGNSALPLVSVAGDPHDDGVVGAMRPTPTLNSLPLVRQVISSLQAVVGRTRLMRIDGDADATSHSDLHYYWQDRYRVHVPIRTTPDVRFVCGEASAHMAEGECWIFDTVRRHNVINAGASSRIHLVIDTVGSAEFAKLIQGARRHDQLGDWSPRRITANALDQRPLRLEQENAPSVMSPWELRERIEAIFDLVPAAQAPLAAAMRLAVAIPLAEWRALWAIHGERQTAHDAYQAVRDHLATSLQPWRGEVSIEGTDAIRWIEHAALRPALAESSPASSPTPPRTRTAPHIERPVFIISPPRSGSTLLFETLAQSPSLYSIGGESHAQIESIAALAPAARGYDSNRLSAADASPDVIAALHRNFLQQLRDRNQQPPAGGPARMLEKTPKNALRIRFLAAAFPDAQFIYLYRDPRETLASMIDAWSSGRFVTYPELPDWVGPRWSMLLTPGWRKLSGCSLAEIVARQWATTVECALDDLQALPADRWCVADYAALVADPQAEMERLCPFLALDWDRSLSAPLPNSSSTLTSPDPDKWRRHREALDEVVPFFEPAAKRAHALFAQAPLIDPIARRSPAQAAPAKAAAFDFSSVHSTSFTELLSKLGISLAVSTYQSGRLIVVRASDQLTNTHLRHFASPMGIALGKQHLAIGALKQVHYYRNQPEAGVNLEPVGIHDACFLPANTDITGDIRVHELVYDDSQTLWLVNTRFSCLCTLDSEHSFVPRWQPRFISAVQPEDRCHLNGVAVDDGRVRYVTALGVSDQPNGWRERKADGGVIIDIASNEQVAHGLSMPHSPRVHQGRLWFLASGRGELNTVELATGAVTTVAQLPGFTRGLAFAGPYAFVGLSKVREKVFDGLPLSQRLSERNCGVWVVDTRSGRSIALLKFQGNVEEIFDIQILPYRYPEIAEPDAEASEDAFVLPDAKPAVEST